MKRTSKLEEKKEKGLLMREKDVWKEGRERISAEEKEELEKRELPPEEEEAIHQQLRKEIEMMELSEELKAEAAQKAKKIEFLGEKEKMKRLIEIARERGVVFSVGVAKDMNDPYVLDTFHDLLVKEGFYKKFLKK